MKESGNHVVLHVEKVVLNIVSSIVIRYFWMVNGLPLMMITVVWNVQRYNDRVTGKGKKKICELLKTLDFHAYSLELIYFSNCFIVNIKLKGTNKMSREKNCKIKKYSNKVE